MRPVFAAAFFTGVALAEGAAPSAPTLTQGLSPFIPLILIFAIFYFLVLRPQQKKMKLQQQFLKDLKRGDRVVTNGGIIGTIRTIGEKLITLEIDEGVCLKMLRSQVLENATNIKDEAKS